MTNIKKWRVRKLLSPDGWTGTYPWHVIPPGMPTPRDTYEARDFFYDERLTTWHTHQMALAHADEQSRTIEVTLPRDPLVWESGWDSDGRVYVRDINDNEICYEPGQLEPLALHLLAHHYRKARA